MALVTANSDLTALTIEQINWLISEAGSTIEVEEATFVQMNASDEAQYEVVYNSIVNNALVTNHVFIDIDIDGDPRLTINDLDPEEDLFAD